MHVGIKKLWINQQYKILWRHQILFSCLIQKKNCFLQNLPNHESCVINYLFGFQTFMIFFYRVALQIMNWNDQSCYAWQELDNAIIRIVILISSTLENIRFQEFYFFSCLSFTIENKCRTHAPPHFRGRI